MPEVAHAGEHHRHAVFVGGGDDFPVPHGTTRLNDGGNAALGGGVKTVAKREERVRGHHRAAQLEAQLAELAAKKTARGIIITLGDVLFGTDLSRLTPDGMRSARKLADVLQQNPQRKVLIEGFADSTGGADYNQGLSERRAGAVRTALLDLGVARERIDMRGYGEAFPVAANDSAASRQLNRRVEIVLSDDSGKLMAR